MNAVKLVLHSVLDANRRVIVDVDAIVDVFELSAGGAIVWYTGAGNVRCKLEVSESVDTIIGYLKAIGEIYPTI